MYLKLSTSLYDVKFCAKTIWLSRLQQTSQKFTIFRFLPIFYLTLVKRLIYYPLCKDAPTDLGLGVYAPSSTDFDIRPKQEPLKVSICRLSLQTGLIFIQVLGGFFSQFFCRDQLLALKFKILERALIIFSGG